MYRVIQIEHLCRVFNRLLVALSYFYIDDTFVLPASMTDPLAADPLALATAATSEIWFAQVEAQFACHRISPSKSGLTTSLSPEYATVAKASSRQFIRCLKGAADLSNSRLRTVSPPAAVYSSGDHPSMASGSFLRELFLQRLPHSVRMVLASTPDTSSLDKLADMADKL